MTMPGGWELIAIVFIVLLLFGSRKLPELSRSIGTSIKEFRKGTREAMEDDEDGDRDAEPRRDRAETDGER